MTDASGAWPDRSPVRAGAVGWITDGPDGRMRVLRERGGEAPLVLEAGWEALSLFFLGSEAPFLLALRREGGGEAAWFLDGVLHVIAHGLGELAPDVQAAVRGAVARAATPAVRFVLDGVPFADGAPSILTLGDVLLAPLLRGDGASAEEPCLTLSSSAGTLPPQPDRNGAARPIGAGHLAALFGRTMLDLAPVALRDGVLVLPSPVDGALLHSDACLPLSHFVFAYRFDDVRYDLPFLVVTTMHVCRPAAVFFPLTDTTVARDRADLDYLRHHHPGAPLGQVIRDRVAAGLCGIVAYLSAPIRRPALFCFHEHLGHHLWQELSGLDALAPAMETYGAPEVMVLNPAATEMFGPLEELYPALRDRIDRRHASMADLTAEAWRRGLFLLAPTAAFIGRGLAARVLRRAEAADATAHDRTLLAEERARGARVVLLGLRVENRTVSRFPDFALSLADMLREEAGGPLCLVVDGHSSRNGRTFDSHSHGRMREEPVAVERRIATALWERFAGSGVSVVDTVGAPMERSLFWSRHADCFVTPWGAGLAKYRWLADRPGLVLAGRSYQDGVFDLRIYDDPRFTDATERMSLIPREGVEDVADPDMLVPIDDLQRVNYRVDPEVLRLALRRLLAVGQASAVPGRPMDE